jgi:zinc transporter ZupT
MSQDMLLWAAVRVTVFKDGMRQRVIKGLTAAVAASPALAFAGDDLAGMAEAAAEGAKSTQKSLLIGAQFVGVLFVVGGLIGAKTKKDNPQVKTGHIIGSILFGVCLMVIPEIIKRSQTQLGLAPVDVG